MKKNILLAILILSSNLGISQTVKYPNAQPGYDGIYVLLSGTLKNSSFKVDRSEFGKDNWTNIGKVKMVNSSQEFVSNFQSYSNLFPDLLQPKNDELENLWITLQKTKILDSVFYYGNSPVVRIALGLSYFDGSAKEGISYIYKISEYDSVKGTSVSFITNQVKFPLELTFAKPLFSNSRMSSNSIFIQWRTVPNERLSSFLVFRQTNSKDDYSKVSVSKGFSTQRDSVVLTIQDLGINPNNLYNYFLVPIDIFGNRGDASEIVQCGAYDFSSVVLPTNISVNSIDSLSALVLRWQIPAEQAVTSMELFRSEYFDSAYTLVANINLTDNEYVDQAIKPMKTYFYYFRLIGPLGEISPITARVFGFCQSSEVPIPPSNIKAESISNGIKITWENTEDFIDGFWVYRADNSDDSLKLVSSLIKEKKPINEFYDTTGLSGKLTYNYSIRSSSTSHVLSNFSDTISIRPNIKTNPPQPTEFTVQFDDYHALLKWKNMMEIDSTVWGYNIYRRTTESNKKSEFKTLTDSVLGYNQNYFVDNTIQPGKEYEYQVIAYDWFGNSSDPSFVSLNYSYPKPIAPEGLTASQSKNGIELSWDESLQSKIKEYKIYKQLRGSKPLQLGTVKPGKELKVSDKLVKKGELYFYYVTVINQYNIESDASQIVSFRF